MNISVSTKRIGCGICSMINPEVFDITGNFAVVNPYYIAGNEEKCIDALFECPVNAIKIVG